MSSSFGFDRQITAWLDEQAPLHEPEDLADAALARTRRTRQLPSWATLERWLPMETRYKFGAVPRTALILVILGVLLAVVSAIAVGQQPSIKLPPSLGVARNGLIAFDDGGDIVIVNADGSGRRSLTSGTALDTSPEWSDDGTRIAYFSQQYTDGPASIKVMDADGGDQRILVEGVIMPPVSWHVSWSHDGRSLAYADRFQHSFDRIMVVPVAGGGPVELVSPGQAPTWSPDDTMIAYQSGGNSTHGTTVAQGLSVIGADGTGQRLIDDTSTTNPWAYAYPQWSPDGTQLAYHAGRPGATNDIFLATVDSGSILAIGDLSQDRVWSMWSPDGTRIAYMGPSSTEGMFQVGVMDTDGTHIKTLSHPPLGCNCAFVWSPDGTKVVVWLDGPSQDGLSLTVADASEVVPAQTIPLTSLGGSSMSWQRLAE